MRSRPFLPSSHVELFALAVLLVTAAAVDARAQSRPPARSPAENNAKAATQARQAREATLRGAEMNAMRPVARTFDATALDEVRKNFERLQVLRNEIVRKLAAGGPMDYGFLAAKAAEVNKRASRLRTQLMPYTPGVTEKLENQKLELREEQMPNAVVALCKTIDSFAENPVFNQPGVVDIQDSAKAGGDLQNIVVISDGIKRGAKRFGRR